MKSFFKKLAFVMALAMVVSMVAPAGSALAAATGVSLQGTKTIVETYELAKDATVDFSFQGCTNWKAISAAKDFAWTSSNTAVATVDQDGLVTAVAAGTATITITAGADYKESVVVTVKGADAAFEVAQTNLTDFTMTFDAKKDVKAEDLEVVMMIGDVEAPIPVKKVAVKENVATVTLFSEFVDGVVYNVTYAGATQTFEGSIGEIDHVAFTYWTLEAGDGLAYVSTEEEQCSAKLEYKLFDANNVDVTAAYAADELTVEYEFATESEAYEIMDNEVTFFEAGAAVVNMTVTWVTDDADEIVKAFTGVVVATKRPALTHTIAEAGFIVPGWYDDAEGAAEAFLTNADSIFWKDNSYLNSWVLGDGGDMQFAAVVKDNRGNTIVTGLNQPGDYATDAEGNVIYPYGYFKFVTSNDEVVDVDDAGLLSFWGKGTASIITYFVDTTGEEEKEVFVGSTKLTVSPERYPASYALSSSTLTTYTEAANYYHNTGADWASDGLSLVLTVRDQYGSNIALVGDDGAIETELKTESDKIPAAADEARIISSADRGCTYNWCGNSQGGYHYHLFFDGNDFDEYVGEKDAYKTVQYAVTLDKDENDKLSGNGTTKVKVIIRNTDAYAASIRGEEGADELTKWYYSVASAYGKSGVDAVVNNMKNFKLTKNNDLTKWVAVNIRLVDKNGLWMDNVASANIVELGEDQKTGDAGVIYYTVTGPKAAYNKNGTLKNWKYDLTTLDGNPVVMATFNTEADAEGAYTGYAAPGTYKITTYYVKNNMIGDEGYGKLSVLSTNSFNVTNSQPDPKFAGYDAKLGNKTSEVLEGASVEDLLDIVKANLDFTYDGALIDWDNTDFDIAFAENGYKADAKKLRVNKVIITVALDDGATKSETYSKAVSVGKTIYFEEEE